MNTYIRLAIGRFQQVELRKGYRSGQVVCRAVVESALDSALGVGRVEVHLFHCVSSMSVDPLRCHYGKEGSRRLDFEDALPGFLVSQPSPFCEQETQHSALSFLGPRRAVLK